MLDSLSTADEVKNNDIVQELVNSCKSGQTQVTKMLENGEVTNEQQMEKLLQINDSTLRVLSKYESAINGQFTYKPTPLSNTVEPQDPFSTAFLNTTTTTYQPPSRPMDPINWFDDPQPPKNEPQRIPPPVYQPQQQPISLPPQPAPRGFSSSGIPIIVPPPEITVKTKKGGTINKKPDALVSEVPNDPFDPFLQIASRNSIAPQEPIVQSPPKPVMQPMPTNPSTTTLQPMPTLPLSPPIQPSHPPPMVQPTQPMPPQNPYMTGPPPPYPGNPFMYQPVQPMQPMMPMPQHNPFLYPQGPNPNQPYVLPMMYPDPLNPYLMSPYPPNPGNPYTGPYPPSNQPKK